MSIADKITRLTAARDDIRAALEDKGINASTHNYADFANDITSILHGIPVISNHTNAETGLWDRPVEWPDVESIELPSDFDGIYLTYDLTKTPGYGWIGVYVQTKTNTTYLVERGHLENSAFVVDESHTVAWKGYFRQALDDTYGNVQLWRVSSLGQIERFGFTPNTDTNNNNFNNFLQPCVEKYGQLPYIISLQGSYGTSWNSVCYSTQWLESDIVDIGRNSVVSSLIGAWQNCYSLQNLKVSNWNTTDWEVSSLLQTWQNCYSLQFLDLSKWDTSNWVVTSLAGTWDGCYNLFSLDLSKWNTSNWRITSLNNTWQYCYLLQKLQISTWNTSNWVVTTFAGTWYYCYSLLTLDLSKWDTSNWVVNNCQQAWGYCYSLQELDIENWDTSNWVVTTLYWTWGYCESLSSLDLSQWDVSNWRVTRLESTWTDMRSLQSLDVSTWDTSLWTVNQFNYAWAADYCLKELDIANWDTSNWVVSTLQGTWKDCFALSSLDLTKWDTYKWVVTNLNSTWVNCFNLTSLNLSHWDTSNWAITSIGSCWQNCIQLVEIDISMFDVSNWNITSVSNNLIGGCVSLVKCLFPSGLNVKASAFQPPSNLVVFSGITGEANQTYTNCNRLTKQSLLNIIDRLPEVSTTKTLGLGQSNKLKLTASEIAVATQKGWTVT